MKLITIAPQQPLDHLASGGRIGLISLATDFNIEADLQRICPAEIEFFTSRVKNINPLTIDNLRSMADTILPGTKLDAII